MTSDDIRRENARALAAQVGGRAKFARVCGFTDSRVSQLLGENPSRNIGKKVAASIEDAFQKERGWLDKNHALNTQPVADALAVQLLTQQENKLDLMYLSQEEIRLVTAYREANEMGKNMFRTTMKNAPRDEERLRTFSRPA